MIGLDIQEVERLKNPQKLLEKIALDDEIAYINTFSCDFSMHVASLWAAKEACFKALDVRSEEVSFREIQLFHKPNGAPQIQLFGKAKARFEQLGATKIEVSISNQKGVVAAVVLIL